MDVLLVSNELHIKGSKYGRVKKPCWFLPLDLVVFDKVCSIDKRKSIKNKN